MVDTSLQLLSLVTLVTFWPIANADGPCYWRTWPICALQKCRNRDTFMFSIGPWTCRSNHFCCPLGSQNNIVFCGEKGLDDCHAQSMEPEKCLIEAEGDRAKSTILLADCYRMYENVNCIGPSRAVRRETEGHIQNLADIGMDKVFSVSLCSENDQCLTRRSKRSSSSNNGYNCRFFTDVVNIGPQPGLPRTTTNLDNSRPIQFYQLGPNGRTEFMQATVRLNDLGTGTQGPSRTPGDRISRIGLPGDDAAHILGVNLGGSGTDARNIFPQSPHFNRGAWNHHVEGLVAQVVREVGSAEFSVNLIYDTPTATRPSRLFWRLQWVDILGRTQTMANDLENPPPGENGE